VEGCFIKKRGGRLLYDSSSDGCGTGHGGASGGRTGKGASPGRIGVKITTSVGLDRHVKYERCSEPKIGGPLPEPAFSL
jgi:hypothetical protein